MRIEERSAGSVDAEEEKGICWKDIKRSSHHHMALGYRQMFQHTKRVIRRGS